MNAGRFDILNGPSRGQIFDACQYGCDKNSHINLDFSVMEGYSDSPSNPGALTFLFKIEDLAVTGIKHEDESGHNFIIEGFCKIDLSHRKWGMTRNHFKAFYNTKTRTGKMEFKGV